MDLYTQIHLYMNKDKHELVSGGTETGSACVVRMLASGFVGPSGPGGVRSSDMQCSTHNSWVDGGPWRSMGLPVYPNVLINVSDSEGARFLRQAVRRMPGRSDHVHRVGDGPGQEPINDTPQG